MFFGGIVKNSLIDYPGKISCVLFVSGCNFECPYCHNPGLVKGKGQSDVLSEDNAVDFLESRKGFLDGVVISGGEPTLKSDLSSFCERVKNLGYPVKLDTNGSRPQAIKELVDRGLVDYIAMDIKTDPNRYSPFITANCNPDAILSSINIIMESGFPYEFRTTCVRPVVDEEAIANISRLIKGAMLYVLQCFHSKDVLYPDFFKDRRLYYNELDIMHLKAIAEPMVKRAFVR
ncbi:MAG TPA: anaerobic ribonucleoside-triphosphate reductase activating protein [Desulfobacteraceae bacterium]|nr:anaerobic ribonucleoside-triphosphate reductase activating protein [Desulfobacteraceae bacterium]